MAVFHRVKPPVVIHDAVQVVVSMAGRVRHQAPAGDLVTVDRPPPSWFRPTSPAFGPLQRRATRRVGRSKKSSRAIPLRRTPAWQGERGGRSEPPAGAGPACAPGGVGRFLPRPCPAAAGGCAAAARNGQSAPFTLCLPPPQPPAVLCQPRSRSSIPNYGPASCWIAVPKTVVSGPSLCPQGPCKLH